ncbi:RidA family protein [Cesiribacter andamanensis]|nr:RidA family protein [Cesiribacter andamanensis]
MHSPTRSFSGSPWESIFGYCRAIRIGNQIEVSGTTAVDEEGQLVGEGDVYAQSRYIIQKAQKALQALGADLPQVVRTRTYVTDIGRWQEVARAHGEAFGQNPPAATMVEVAKLIAPQLLVEMEFTAVLPHE